MMHLFIRYVIITFGLKKEEVIMQKVKIQTTLFNSDIKDSSKVLDVVGTIDNNCITYLDDDLTVIIKIGGDITLIRENNFYQLSFTFNENVSEGSYLLKDGKINFPISIKTNKILVEASKIVIDYQTDIDNHFTFTLTYEVIE